MINSFTRCLLIFTTTLHVTSVFSVKCKNDELEMHKAVFDFGHEIYFDGTPDNIRILLRLYWNISGVDEKDYDGFLVKLRDNSDWKINFSPKDCQASTSHLWVTTTNESICDISNQTEDQCSILRRNSEASCICPKTSCSLITGPKCIGSTTQLKTNPPSYSIPKSRPSVTYEVEFNHEYKFQMSIYYRQWIKQAEYDIDRILNCPEIISANFSISLKEAAVVCCRSNISILAPIDFQRGELIPDYSTGTLNFTASWLGPEKQYLLQNVYMLIAYAPSADEVVGYPPYLTEFSPPLSSVASNSCSSILTRHSSTAYGLLPDTEYTISIVAGYKYDRKKEVCESDKCKMKISIQTDFNPCDNKWHSCANGTVCVVKKLVNEPTIPSTTCVPTTHRDQLTSSAITKQVKVNETISTTEYHKFRLSNSSAGITCEQRSDYCNEFAACIEKTANASTLVACFCSEGMQGNGISEKYNGTGCSGCSILNDCDDLASCVAMEPVSLGYKCQCDEHHYGDGRKSGTGCNSWAKRTASIAVPVLIIGLILIAVILWWICTPKRRSKNRLDRQEGL